MAKQNVSATVEVLEIIQSMGNGKVVKREIFVVDLGSSSEFRYTNFRRISCTLIQDSAEGNFLAGKKTYSEERLFFSKPVCQG